MLIQLARNAPLHCCMMWVPVTCHNVCAPEMQNADAAAARTQLAHTRHTTHALARKSAPWA
jgi:hypothetical protein